MAKKVTTDGEIIEPETPFDNQAVFWKTPNNHDTMAESNRTALTCRDPSLTKQEFVADADINNIINRFLKTGEPPPMAIPEHFLDLTGRRTYFDMQQQLAEANAQFYTLNAGIRAQFSNSPELWADEVVHLVEQGNVEKLREIGIDIGDKKPVEAAPAAATDTGGAKPATPAAPPPGTPPAAS